MSDRYIAKFAVSPYNSVPQERCGPREQTVTLMATSIKDAFASAELIVQAILTNPYIWLCKVTEVREAQGDECLTATSPQRLTRGDSDAVFKIDRDEIAKAERKGRSEAEVNAIRQTDKLKLEIERLTFMVDALARGNATSEGEADAQFTAHRKLQIEQFEAV